MTKTQILIVKDDAVEGMDIAKQIEKLGYTVSAIISSGEKAIEKAKEILPDLVLMDISIKGEMDWSEAAEIIRSRFGIPIIFLAAHDDEEKVMRAKFMMPFGCITKPIRPIDLRIYIEMALYVAEVDAERIRMEKELRKREENFFLTLDSIGDAVITTDDKGFITRMNPVAEVLTGWKLGEAKGLPLIKAVNIISEFSRENFKSSVEKILTEGKVVSIVNHAVLISKDGSEYIINNKGAPIRDKYGNIIGVVMVFRDITENRKNEIALMQSEHYYRTLLHSMHEDILIINRDYQITDVNNTFLVTYGLHRDEVIGKPCYEISHGYNEPCMQRGASCELLKVFNTGDVRKCVHQHRHADGTKRYVKIIFSPLKDEKDNVVQVVEAIHDITELIKTNKELKKSEANYREIFDLVNDIIVVHDINTGKLLDVNRKTIETFGYSPDEFFTMGMGDLSEGKPPYNHKKADKLIQKAIGGEPQIFEWLCKKKNGDLFWAEINLKRAYINGNEVILAVVRDIEERKKVESELREREKKFRELFNNANDAIYLHELTEDGIPGKFIEVNEIACKRLGYTRDEYLTMFPGNIDAGEKSFEVSDIMKKLLRQRHVTFEMVHVAKDGTRFPVEISSHTFESGGERKVLSIARDLTEWRRTESELKKLGEAVQHASEGIVVTELNGKIIYINPAFEQITGYNQDEVVGQTPRILKSGRHDVLFYKDLWRTILNGNLWRGRIVNKRKDGSLFTAECSISPVKNEEGHVVNFVWITRDISSEIKLEEWVRQSQKMESIGTLAGGIAHDFNNILATIVGCAELSLDDVPKGTVLYNNLEEVLKAGIRAKDLVKQILTFSRQTDHELQALKVQHIIKEVLKLSRSTLPSTIEIKQNISNQCGLVMADATQVHQIAMNLITNAYHAMGDDGGTLEVSLKEVDLGPEELKNSDMITGTYICLTVKDTGIGMDRAIIDRIFEPYFTTKGDDKGTGLGLSVVHGIVKSYKGDISVYSEPGKGTIFDIYLPVIETKAEKERTENTSIIQEGSERILLVDDENMVLRMEKQTLERLGYHVTPRTSSIEALEAFRAKPDKFDLVITDMTMPNMTGVKLSQKILRIKPEMPIIICTGFSEKISEERVKEMGIKGYIMKPVAIRELAKTIRAILDDK